eukprot:scaffold41220_cov71-Phaeocystis_antarctica.AAC.12
MGRSGGRRVTGRSAPANWQVSRAHNAIRLSGRGIWGRLGGSSSSVRCERERPRRAARSGRKFRLAPEQASTCSTMWLNISLEGCGCASAKLPLIVERRFF